MPRKPRTKPLVIGVAGNQSMAKAAVGSLLEDYIGDRDISFMLALQAGEDGSLPAGLKYVAEWVVAEGIEYDIVVDKEGTESDWFEKWSGDAEHVIKAAKPGERMVRELKKLGDDPDAPVDVVVVMPFDGGDADTAVFALADEYEIQALNLNDALEPITWAEGDAQEGAAEEPADEDEDAPDDEPVAAAEGPVFDWDSEELAEQAEKPPATREEAAKKGVRWLRRWVEAGTDLKRRAIGQMNIEQCLDIIYGGADVVDQPDVIDPDNIPPQRTLVGHEVQETEAVQMHGRTRADIEAAGAEIASLRASIQVQQSGACVLSIDLGPVVQTFAEVLGRSIAEALKQG